METPEKKVEEIQQDVPMEEIQHVESVEERQDSSHKLLKEASETSELTLEEINTPGKKGEEVQKDISLEEIQHVERATESRPSSEKLLKEEREIIDPSLKGNDSPEKMTLDGNQLDILVEHKEENKEATPLEEGNDVNEKGPKLIEITNVEVIQMEAKPLPPLSNVIIEDEETMSASEEDDTPVEEISLASESGYEESSALEDSKVQEISINDPQMSSEILEKLYATNFSTPRFDLQQNEVSKSSSLESASTLKTPHSTKSNCLNLSSGLSLLAQYDSESDREDLPDENNSDDDKESVVEVPLQNYRSQVVEIDSESSSSEDSDVEFLSEIRQQIDKSMAVDDDSDEDDEEGTNANTRKRRQPLKVKGELLLEELPPIEDLHITVPEEECVELGKINSIVEQLVLVNTLPNSLLLDLDTVLFLEKGKKVLGEVFDVLGPVSDPLYCIRFNSNQQILEKNIKVGDVVYVAPQTEHTQFVILSSLMKAKGSDASWLDDVEPPPRFLDYSDDEEERVARNRLRNKKRHATGETIVLDDDDDNESNSQKSKQNPFGNNHQQRYGQNYNARPHYPQHQRNNDSWHSNYAPRNPNHRSYHNRFPRSNFNRNPSLPPMYNPYGGMMPPAQLQMSPQQMSVSPSNFGSSGFNANPPYTRPSVPNGPPVQQYSAEQKSYVPSAEPPPPGE